MDPTEEELAPYRYAAQCLKQALERHGVDRTNVNSVTRVLHISDAPNDDGMSGLYYKDGQAIMRVSMWQKFEWSPITLMPHYRRIFIIQDLVDASDQQQEEESTG